VTRTARDGHGHRAYRRAQAALKRRTRDEGLTCTWCGEPIDTTLPDTHPRAFTADHPDALANGGRLAGQQLQPMHRRCNALKGDHADVEIWPAS
jgi:5-methylcytosine-specific restriction endonuclease McrA